MRVEKERERRRRGREICECVYVYVCVREDLVEVNIQEPHEGDVVEQDTKTESERAREKK